jgi:hypothetical protein
LVPLKEDLTIKTTTEDEFPDEIQTIVLRFFLHIYSFALRFIFLHTHATSHSFCKGERRNLIENRTPFPLVYEIYTEASSLRTLKIMARNLNEIVRSEIRLLTTTFRFTKMAKHPLQAGL